MVVKNESYLEARKISSVISIYFIVGSLGRQEMSENKGKTGTEVGAGKSLNQHGCTPPQEEIKVRMERYQSSRHQVDGHWTSWYTYTIKKEMNQNYLRKQQKIKKQNDKKFKLITNHSNNHAKIHPRMFIGSRLNRDVDMKDRDDIEIFTT